MAQLIFVKYCLAHTQFNYYILLLLHTTTYLSIVLHFQSLCIILSLLLSHTTKPKPYILHEIHSKETQPYFYENCSINLFLPHLRSFGCFVQLNGSVLICFLLISKANSTVFIWTKNRTKIFFLFLPWRYIAPIVLMSFLWSS